METKSQAVLEVISLSHEIMDLWKKGDFSAIDNLIQYTYQEEGRTEEHNNDFPIRVPKSFEFLSFKEISEYAVDVSASVVGPCVGITNCKMCGKDITVEYKLRFMRESGPYKPDPNGRFGLNIDSITILCDERCKIREAADSEPVEAEPCNPANT